jgi:tetratricopeptide (TPR) repeat protein
MDIRDFRIKTGYVLILSVLLPLTAIPDEFNIPLEKRLTGTLGTRKCDKQYTEYLKKADYCLGTYEFQESTKYCKLALDHEPEDFLARAMMCLNYYEIAEQLDVKKRKNKKKKIKIYKNMISVAEEGIKHFPDRGECYFMRGLANARISTTKGVLSSLFSAKSIEKNWLKAIRYKSEYTTPNGENLEASANIALGVYYRMCPTFFLIKLLFGISGNLDKSAAYCRKAYDLDPTRIEIVKEYGVSLITRGLKRKNKKDIIKGKKYLKMVKTLPLRLKTDAIDKEHSKILLNDISLCPGYSRDQQQDISKEAFNKSIKGKK